MGVTPFRPLRCPRSLYPQEHAAIRAKPSPIEWVCPMIRLENEASAQGPAPHNAWCRYVYCFPIYRQASCERQTLSSSLPPPYPVSRSLSFFRPRLLSASWFPKGFGSFQISIEPFNQGKGDNCEVRQVSDTVIVVSQASDVLFTPSLPLRIPLGILFRSLQRQSCQTSLAVVRSAHLPPSANILATTVPSTSHPLARVPLSQHTSPTYLPP